MNLAPVDRGSKLAAAVVFDPRAWGQNYNLTGRAETLPELVKDMKLAGMNVRVANWRDWRDDLLRRHAAEPVPELDFLIRILRSPTAGWPICTARCRCGSCRICGASNWPTR
ncbi:MULTISPECIES: hypothetical protein [Streptomyces]|uniref:hypothetical protein n=1 Tax=Streptomyces TaxID=1883 RepID=UPI0004C584FC|nr:MULTISPECIES: hypothetical protein [Streptomyces]RPK82115.1 hypothetical protein EES46_27670 [Streptomyces sp. ADI98-10]